MTLDQWVCGFYGVPIHLLLFWGSLTSHILFSFNDVSSVVVDVLTTLDLWVWKLYGVPIHLLLFWGSLSFHMLLSLASLTSHPSCWCFDDLGSVGLWVVCGFSVVSDAAICSLIDVSYLCCWCFDDLGPVVAGGLNNLISTSCCPCVLCVNFYLWLLVRRHVSPPMMV